MSELAAGIVGLGRMGTQHARALKLLGLRLVGGVDIDGERRAGAAQTPEFDGFPLYVDPWELIEVGCPDILLIATTAPSHCELVKDAARWGVRMILSEKPMASSLSQAQAMVDTCGAVGARLAVNHQTRFTPAYQYLKETVFDGRMGALRSVHVSGANFGLAMNGIHYAEVFEWLVGERLQRVIGRVTPDTTPNPRGASFQDYEGFLMGWTGSGARFSLDCGGDLGHGVVSVFTFEYGRIMFDELSGHARVTCRRPEDRVYPLTRYGTPALTDDFDLPTWSLSQGTAAVLNALIHDADYPSGEDAQRALAVLIAAIDSSDVGSRPILVDEVEPERVFAWA